MTTIHDRLSHAMRLIGPVEKRGINSYDKYKYRTAEDIYAATQVALADSGISIGTEIRREEFSSVASANGKPMNRCVLVLRVTFADGTGSVFVDALGEGMDRGDKAANKAQTAAMKNALTFAFLLAGAEDSEAHSPEVARGAPATPHRARPERGQDKRAPGTGDPAPSREALALRDRIYAETDSGKLGGYRVEAAKLSDRERAWIRKILDRRIEIMTGEIANTTSFPTADKSDNTDGATQDDLPF